MIIHLHSADLFFVFSTCLSELLTVPTGGHSKLTAEQRLTAFQIVQFAAIVVSSGLLAICHGKHVPIWSVVFHVIFLVHRSVCKVLMDRVAKLEGSQMR